MKYSFLLCLICISSCSLLRGPNYVDKEGRRQGLWLYTTVADPDQVESKGRFKDDRPWGKWKYYDTNGRLLRKEKYKRKNEGIFIKTRFYYPNQQVEKEGLARVDYHSTKTHYYWIGKWKYYHETGELAAIKLFTKNAKTPVVLMEAAKEKR